MKRWTESPLKQDFWITKTISRIIKYIKQWSHV